jgi:hypothetical protein
MFSKNEKGKGYKQKKYGWADTPKEMLKAEKCKLKQ